MVVDHHHLCAGIKNQNYFVDFQTLIGIIYLHNNNSREGLECIGPKKYYELLIKQPL